MLTQNEKQKIKKKVVAALKKLEENDSILLENSVNERTISCRLAMYMQKQFEFNVDSEYNKHGIDLEKLLMRIKECSPKNELIVLFQI